VMHMIRNATRFSCCWAFLAGLRGEYLVVEHMVVPVQEHLHTCASLASITVQGYSMSALR
jgi:hypothetical protein